MIVWVSVTVTTRILAVEVGEAVGFWIGVLDMAS